MESEKKTTCVSPVKPDDFQPIVIERDCDGFATSFSLCDLEEDIRYHSFVLLFISEESHL
jgi:hypothetical protein